MDLLVVFGLFAMFALIVMVDGLVDRSKRKNDLADEEAAHQRLLKELHRHD